MLELAVSIAVGAIIFLILGGIFLAQGRFFAIQDALSETQYNAFLVADTVGLYASSAQEVVSGRTINGTAYTTGTNTVIFRLPSVDADGDVIGGAYDYVALGLAPADSSRFMFDIDAATGSDRLDGQYVRASLVKAVIFRYNAVDPADATNVELYVLTETDARGQTVSTPLGKIYYLGSS